MPIYVGKAVPAGTRKGGFGLDIEHGSVLYHRLVEHAESVKAAVNLDIADFFCRFLVVDDIWIPLAESVLIEKFKPVWNFEKCLTFSLQYCTMTTVLTQN